MIYCKKGCFDELVIILNIDERDVVKIKRIDKEINKICHENDDYEKFRTLFIERLKKENIKFIEINKSEIIFSDSSLGINS